MQKIDDLSQHVLKLNTENAQLRREEVKLNQELEQLKSVRYTWQTKMQQSQEQHEQDTINYKKMMHKLRVEKDELSKQLQELTEQQQQKRQSIHQVELRPIAETAMDQSKPKELSSGTLSTPSLTCSKGQFTLHYEAEVNTLRASLEQAHEIIQSMQATIDKEREERSELDQLLREAQETIEHQAQNVSKIAYEWQSSEPSSKCSTPPRSPSLSSLTSKRRHPMKVVKKGPSIHSSHTRYNTSKSLGDELSRAGSTATFLNTSTNQLSHSQIVSAMEEMNDFEPHEEEMALCKDDDIIDDSEYEEIARYHKDLINTNNHCTANEGENTTDGSKTSISHMLTDRSVEEKSDDKETPIDEPLKEHKVMMSETRDIGCNTEPMAQTELSSFSLPCICNHDVLLNNEELDTAQVELQQTLSNHEHYGSLIKEPESYIYNSQRRKTPNDKKEGFSPIKMNFSDNFNVDTTLDTNPENSAEECGESSMKAMTRAMIGDWMWKYTKRVVGFRKLENKHRRFFWIHPYSQTLYWNTKEPGTKASQNGTKSGKGLYIDWYSSILIRVN